MKQWIKEQLREGLREMSPVYKPVYGGGTEHTLYPSKNNPNILYKVGKEQTVLRWVNIFKKYPDMFPKVYKIGKITNPYLRYYVEVEKLDTNEVQTTLSKLAEMLSVRDVWELFSDALENEEYADTLITNIKTHTPKAYPLFNEWFNFLQRLKFIVRQNGMSPDFHEGNFAYDHQGNIKAIDI